MTVSQEILGEMRRLVLREGFAIETVTRRFGVHHSVVRRALRDDPVDRRKTQAEALEPFKQYIVKRLTELPRLTGVRLFEELKERSYEHGIAVLRRYVAKVRQPKPRKAFLTVEAAPGEQAQVDWGSFGRFRIGSSQRPLSVFSMVMSWSRAMFIDFSLDQKTDTFLRMHRRALEFFGGVPKRILYDNLKSVVLHHVGSTVQFNPRFLAFAGHYLFEPVAAPVRYPQAKGKVESSIKYIRQSFFYGRSFSSLADLRAKAATWRDQTANQRIHATTRERPAERLRVETTRLHSLPRRPFDTDLVIFPSIVPKEARVRLDANTYSVPPEYVGRTVTIRADDHIVRVLCDGEEIASHNRCFEKHRAIEDKTHIEQLLERRKAARGPKRKDRLANLAPECRAYLQEVARRNINLENEVKKLIRLVDRYGETEVAGGMTEALGKRTFGARYVRALIDQARFKRGLKEPPEPVVTGNPAADRIIVEPHPLETYDAIQKIKGPKHTKETDPHPQPRPGADHVAQRGPRDPRPPSGSRVVRGGSQESHNEE